MVRIERLRRADYDALGPAGVAARLRSLVPDGASVAAAVSEIVAHVRDYGDEALLDYSQRFDTGGEEPLPLRVAPEALDAAIQTLPLDVVAGLQVAITNVAEVAQAGVGEDGPGDPPTGSPRARARGSGRLGGGVRAGGPRAVSEQRRDGRGHRPRRRGDRRRGVRAAGTGRRHPPGHPRHLPAVRRLDRVPHGRRAGDRRARLRHGDGRARRRDRRPGQPLRPGGQAPGLPPRRDRRLRRAERPARRPRPRRRPPSRRARSARAGRARGGQPRRRARAPRSISSRRSRRSCASIGERHPLCPRRRARSCRCPMCARRSPWPTRSRPSTCSSSAPRPRRSPRSSPAPGCVFVGAAERDGVRRLRRRLQPRAADRRRRPLRLRALAAPLPPPHGRGAHRRRREQARGRRRRRSPDAEGFLLHAESMEARASPPAGVEALRENEPR